MRSNRKIKYRERIDRVKGTKNYFVTTHGRVFRFVELKQDENNKGYLRVKMSRRKNKRRWELVSRLVAEHFRGGIPDNFTVDHKDNNKQNNYYRNLDVITLLENIIRRDRRRK